MEQYKATIQYGLSSILKKLTFSFFLLLLFSTCQVDNNDLAGIVGSKAPAFTLTSSVGNQVNLLNYNNKVVVLFFFGNDCPFCKAAAPEIERMIIGNYANRTDYVVLGLDYWNGSSDLVQAFQKSTGLSFPLLLDAGNVATNYKTTYNRIVIIDKNQNIVFSGTQCASNDLPAVKQKLDMLFAN